MQNSYVFIYFFPIDLAKYPQKYGSKEKPINIITSQCSADIFKIISFHVSYN